jgi:aspartyl-tRNA(Asn)/glutamyl-tRNA(Gln) amidotransferase subunit C
MPVSEKDVEHVADLANLQLTTDEKAKMRKDLNSVLDYIAQLNELDTSAVPPIAQVSELLPADNGANAAELRQDTIVGSLERKSVLSQAPDTDGVFFRVPKVIER